VGSPPQQAKVNDIGPTGCRPEASLLPPGRELGARWPLLEPPPSAQGLISRANAGAVIFAIRGPLRNGLTKSLKPQTKTGPCWLAGSRFAASRVGGGGLASAPTPSPTRKAPRIYHDDPVACANLPCHAGQARWLDQVEPPLGGDLCNDCHTARPVFVSEIFHESRSRILSFARLSTTDQFSRADPDEGPASPARHRRRRAANVIRTLSTTSRAMHPPARTKKHSPAFAATRA